MQADLAMQTAEQGAGSQDRSHCIKQKIPLCNYTGPEDDPTEPA